MPQRIERIARRDQLRRVMTSACRGMVLSRSNDLLIELLGRLMIDMQRLRVLREVAQHGSFSKAAAALLLTPSAVSQQIAALERSLGTEVVTRGARGTVLTEPGQLLVETADLILAELRSTQEQIGRIANGHQRRLTVATFASAGMRLLPQALTRFTAAHPDAELTILEYDPEQSLPL